MTKVQPALRVVLDETGGAPALGEEQRYELLRSLLERGYAVERRLAGGGARPEAPPPLLVLHGAPAEEGLGPVELLETVERAREAGYGARPAPWKPWFPVIDYDRCTNCMQCLSFCLFDVYGVHEGKIQVQNQSNCKTDCPACSRVCPEVAILFPKYRSGPINGDEIDPEDLRREAMKVDISALLGGDIYQALRDRSARAKSRFSKERDEERALKERQRCLVQLREQLDIPLEVLASLPTPDQILARAEAAQARAAAAREPGTPEEPQG